MSNELTNPGPEILSLLRRLDEYLSGGGIESYIVGGLVRDMLLGRRTADIDIAVASDAPGVAAGVADFLGGRSVMLDDKNRIARVVLTGENESLSEKSPVIDFSSCSGTITKDLARRDFTIDAMAIDLRRFGQDSPGMEIIDPFHGREDIEQKIVRAVDDRVFLLDAARLLRAVRLAAELGFTIEEETEDLVKEYAHLVFDVPGERTRDELLRLLALRGAADTLSYLDKLGLLTGIFPGLEETRGVEQPKEHFWDVLEHSLATVKSLEFILGENAWEYIGEDIAGTVPLTAGIREHLDRQVSSGSTGKSLLKIAALLHDVGKPGTKGIDESGRMRFFGHGKEGAEEVTAMLERLRFTGKEIKIVETAVNYHMRPTQMSQEGELPTDRAIYRYFRDAGDTGLDILFLNLADHLAARGPELDIEGWRQHVRLVEYVINKHFDKENTINSPTIVNGYDIIKSFGLSPGPQVGEILEAVREAQASGEVTNRAEALSYIDKILKSGNTPTKEY
jgi:poly(A) polymerase